MRQAAQRWILVICSLALLGCQESEQYQVGRQDGCEEAGGTWDTGNNLCLPLNSPPEPVSWMMIQDAQTIEIFFDRSVSSECTTEAFWSGRMKMTGVDKETVWFTNRPWRQIFHESTDFFISNFAKTFAPIEGGNPTAVINWDDATTGEDQNFIVRLLSLPGESPQYTGDTLSYRVCGLRLDDPMTSQPKPDDQQKPPADVPQAAGKFQLLVDAVGGVASCDVVLERTDCYLMGFCGSEGLGRGSCKDKTLQDAQDFGGGCAGSYAEGVADWNNPATLPLCAFFDSYQCR